MLIPCKEIARALKEHIRQKVELYNTHGKSLKLVTYLLGNEPAQLSFVTIKKRLATELGIDFEFIHYNTPPNKQTFLQDLTKKAHDPQTTGVLIQHPLPENFAYGEVYMCIPREKDIEGHRPDSSFYFPLTLSVLNGLKYIYSKQSPSLMNTYTIVNLPEDIPFFRHVLEGKKIVIAGRGITGGQPIQNVFQLMQIPVIQTNSETQNSADIYRTADIIITATGQKIITPDVVKKGVVLLNVGLRKEDGKLKGDYDEQEIQDIASYYTETPGGLGPLDVLYLYKNLIEAVT